MKSFTIRHLLDLPGIKGLRVVTGKTGLDNPITNVNIIDNPDSYEWFTAGDFLLTTGFIYRDNPDQQRRLIRELAEMNCAGLGVKIKRYWNEVPQVMIEEAKLLKLPIVEIPFTYSLAQVSNIINNEIFKRESSLLKKYRAIHETYSRCSLEGGDLWKIVKITAELIGNPVILLDSQFNLLSYVDLETNVEPLNQHLKLVLREKCFPIAFTDTIPNSTDTFTLSIKRHFPDEQGSITCRIIPVAYSNDIYGYFVVWETMRKLESIDYIALENAATTAALERVKTRQLEEARDRMREDFFDDLIAGKIVSINALKSLAKIHGMNPDVPYVVAVLNLDEAGPNELKRFADIAADSARRTQHKVQSIVRQTHLMMFIELELDQQTRAEVYISSFLTLLDSELSHQSSKSYQIGVSNVCQEFSSIGKSAFVALDVIKLSRRITQQHRIHYFKDLIGYYLLDTSNEKGRMREFLNVMLAPLLSSDREADSELLMTLEAFFNANENLSEAAKAMYIHRNTFIYRLEKIKKLLNTDLTDAETNFNLQLALHIRRIVELK